MKKVMLACVVSDSNQVSLLCALSLMELQPKINVQVQCSINFVRSVEHALSAFRDGEYDCLISVDYNLGLPAEFVMRALLGPPILIGANVVAGIDYERAAEAARKEDSDLGLVSAAATQYNLDLRGTESTWHPGLNLVKDIGCVKSVSLFKLDRAVCTKFSGNIMQSLKEWHANGKDILVDISVTAPCFGEMMYGGCIGQRAGALR